MDDVWLAKAGALRRAGRANEAIEYYERVLDCGLPRPRNRDAARFWRARLRMEAGEASALFDLARLIRESPDPHKIVQSALSMLRFERVNESGELASNAFEIEALRNDAIHVARTRLRMQSNVISEEGARAKRWLQRLDVSIANNFSR